MSMSRTLRPWLASAAAMFTAVVVFPTPPFWFAIVKMRVSSGRGKVVCDSRSARRLSRAIAAPMGDDSSMIGIGRTPSSIGFTRL
jgi:hypothetical protein